VRTESGQLGNFPSQNARNRRYSIYSIKDGGEQRARGISELRGQESTPWTHKSFIFKRRLISQAGRRGFEPRLPLQLAAIPTKQPRKNGVNSVALIRSEI
jgi:hypothetical protein